MRATVLGSGTLVPDDRHRSAGHLLETPDTVMLLDCGSGTLHRLGGLQKPWMEVSHLALTHFHTDHVGDLAPLLFALRHAPDPPREAPLTVLGPPGIASFLGALADAHGDHVLDPGFPVEIVELDRADMWKAPGGTMEVRTHPTPHTDRSVGYRIETEGGSLGYTGDTGPSEALGAFMEGVDLLLSECSHPDPPAVDNHLTPARVAALGRRARPSMLVTVHHYPGLIGEAVPDLIAAAGYAGTVRQGRDGLELEVRDRRVRVTAPGVS